MTSPKSTLAFHCYTKLFYTVNHARVTEKTRTQSKLDKRVRTIIIVLPCRALKTWPGSSTSRQPTRTSSRRKRGSRIEASHRPLRLDLFLWKYRWGCPSQSLQTTRNWFISLLTRHESGLNRYHASSCSRRGHWG